MRALPDSVPPTLQQATNDPRLCQRLLDTHGQVWVSFLWGHCSFLLGPGAYRVLFVPSQSLFPVLCTFWQLYGGLLVTSSNRAYAILGSAASRAPAPTAVHCWPVPPQETRKLSSVSVSVGSLGHGGHTRFVWALWASLAGMGFDSKRDFAPPTILLGLLLCPWMWDISLKSLQHSAGAVPMPRGGRGVSPHPRSSGAPEHLDNAHNFRALSK